MPETGRLTRLHRHLACALLAGLTAGLVVAAEVPRGFEDDFDDDLRPWKEIEARLPAAPLPANLEPVYVSAATSYTFAIDRSSIDVASDGVVRYILVGTSSQGARNVSYEGIRCATREKKLYAFGQRDGSWSRSRRNAWERIIEVDRNRQHAALAQAFCEGGLPIERVDEIIRRIRNPVPRPP